MPDPDLNLGGILGKEKLPELAKLDVDFYKQVSVLLASLEAERQSGGSTLKEELAIDQLEVAREQAREIIQERMRKIVRMALAHVVMRSPDEAPAMTSEESELYGTLIRLLSAWRRDRLDQVFGRKAEIKKTAVQETRKKSRDSYVAVRLLTNVPTFVGLDQHNYTLMKNDVVMVPTVNAQALIERKAAVAVKTKI